MLSYFLTSYVALVLTGGGVCEPEEKVVEEKVNSAYTFAVIYADPATVLSLEPVKTTEALSSTDPQIFIIKK